MHHHFDRLQKKPRTQFTEERCSKHLKHMAFQIPSYKLLTSLYCNSRAVVLSQDGETDAFEILAGVLQGDTLTPYLFILDLDFVMKVAIENDEEKPWFTVISRKKPEASCKGNNRLGLCKYIPCYLTHYFKPILRFRTKHAQFWFGVQFPH